MKTNKKNSAVLLLCMILSILNFENLKAGNYTWNGATSTSWTTTTNWTPNGTPGTNDTITIVTGSNNVYLTSSLTVKQITVTSGTLNLQSYSLTVSGTGNFNSGNVNNGTLIVYGTSTQTFKGTQFGAKVKVTGNSILLNGSTFNDSLFVVKKGTSNDNGKGNNTFNGYVSITDSASGNLVLSDSFPDIFNSSLVVSRRSTGNIYLAHRGTGNQFNGNVTFNGSNGYSNYYGTATYSGNIILNGNVYFGYGGGSCVLSTGKNLSIGSSGISAGWLYFKNFVQQDSTSKISLALTGTSQLFFETGSTFNDSITASAPLLYLNGSRFNGVAHLTNNGGTSVTSAGGCYFKKKASIFNSCSTSITYSFSTTAIDTFATDALIQNNIGTLAFAKAVFLSSVTLKNTNTTTGSDRYFISSGGQTIFKGAVTIDNSTSGMAFGNTSGTIILDSSASLSFTSGFTGNITMKGITKLGSSSQNFVFPSASSKLILGPGNTFNGPVSYYGHYIQLNGSTFNSTANITRYGTGNDICNGGNVFNGTTVLKDSSGHSNSFVLANSSEDDFNGDVTFIQKGSGVLIYPAYAKNTTFSKNVTVDATSAVMTFGGNGGNSIFDGGQNQSFSKSSTNSGVFKKLSINKTKNNLTLYAPVTITDSMKFIKGIIQSDSTNMVFFNDNAVVNGASDSSFIEGFINKIGNDEFVFPLGSKVLLSPYHPISISAPSSVSDVFRASYIPYGHPNYISNDSIKMSYCEYWTIKHLIGSSAVQISLGWNQNCQVEDTTNSFVYSFNGSSWSSLGKNHVSLSGFNGSLFSNSALSLSSGNTASLSIANYRTTLSAGGVQDDAPYRGIYVNHFVPRTSSSLSILGHTGRTRELLEYCRENNIQRLDLYNLERIHDWSDLNPISNNTWLVDYCNFVTLAKTTYCIKEIGAIGASESFFDDINDFNTLQITPAYQLSSSLVPNLDSLFPFLRFVQNNYTADDGMIALQSEMIKFYLRINDFNIIARMGGTGCEFDHMTTEIEYWWKTWEWPLFVNVVNFLDNLQGTPGNPPFKIHTYIGYIYDIYERQLCLGAASQLLASESVVTDFVDDKSDRIYLVNYSQFVNALWSNGLGSIVDNCGTPILPNQVPVSFFHSVSMLGSNLKQNTIISPLLGSFTDGFSGSAWWFDTTNSETHTIELYEYNLLYRKRDPLVFPNPDPNSATNLAAIGNSLMVDGAAQWYAYTWMKKNPGTWQIPDGQGYDFCVNNVAFNVRGYAEVCDVPTNWVEACAGTQLNFDYCSVYEPGVKLDWNFGDGTTMPNLDPLLSGTYLTIPHTYICAGVYSVSCNIKFPSGCSFLYTREIHVTGVNIQTVSNSVCNGAYATLNACGGGSYLWTPGGQTTSSISVNPTTTTTYTLTISPAPTTGCPASVTSEIIVNPLPTFTYAQTNANCGSANGSITLTSATAVSYSDGVTTNTTGIFTGLSSGTTYPCTVIDANGCISAIQSVFIGSSGTFTVLATHTNVTCNGGSDGSVTATITGGASPFTYSWSNGSSIVGVFATVNGLPIGSYTCTVTDANGCVNSGSTTITSPTALVASASSTSILCNGGSSIVTVSASGGISPYSGTGTYTVSAGTYYYTVTDANSCSASTSITVSQPAILTSVVTCTNCTTSGSMNVFSNASGGTSPYTYNWNNGVTTIQNLQNVTSGNYEVIVTDANGCTSSGSISLSDPSYYCTPAIPTGNIIHIGPYQPATYLSTIYNQSDIVVIHSDWIVNTNFTFDNSKVIIDPGFKITVLPNCTLTVTNSSVLRSCSTPWQGIVIYSSSSKLIIDKDSELRDAIVGVDATNSAVVVIDDALFDENDVCINLKNYVVNANQITVTSTRFLRGSNIHGFPKVQGIVIQNTTGPAVIDGGSNRNLFDGLYNGLDIVGSDVTLRNNRFTNIVCPTSNCLNGTRASIRASSGTIPTHLIVGGSTANRCIFENCYSGVAAFNNVAMDVQYNVFDNSTYTNYSPSVGVTGVRSTGMTQTILHNDFKYFYYGINLFDANEEIVNIKENIFNNFTTVITNHNLRAITVASTLLNDRGSANVTIESNLIKHHQRGIQMVNQHKANIISNTVYLDNVSPNGFYGIRVQNGAANSANIIISNNVTRLGTSASSMETSALGISVETGTGNVVKENTVTGFGTGIRFYNNMTDNSALCNSLVENYEGITMEASNIGNQGSSGSASDNIWTRGTNTDAHLNAKGNSLSSIWYVQTTGSYYPNGASDIRPLGYYALLPGTASSCAPPCSNPACIQEIIARIVKEQGEFYNLNMEKKYFASKYAFEMLAKDSSLMFLNSANDSIIRIFYDAYRNGNIDLMAKVKDYIIKNDSTNAEYLNSSITPENLSEENEKYFNQIYLETWGKYNFELDSIQNNTLEEIAYQNPISGGSAVYGARTILNLDLSDNIGEISERRKEQELVTKSDLIMTGKLFPNPTSGEFTLILANSPESKGILEIYDIIGNLVQSQFFYPKEKEVKINLTSRVAGLYTIKIVIDDSVQGYEKIVVQK